MDPAAAEERKKNINEQIIILQTRARVLRTKIADSPLEHKKILQARLAQMKSRLEALAKSLKIKHKVTAMTKINSIHRITAAGEAKPTGSKAIEGKTPKVKDTGIAVVRGKGGSANKNPAPAAEEVTGLEDMTDLNLLSAGVSMYIQATEAMSDFMPKHKKRIAELPAPLAKMIRLNYKNGYFIPKGPVHDRFVREFKKRFKVNFGPDSDDSGSPKKFKRVLKRAIEAGLDPKWAAKAKKFFNDFDKANS